MDLVIATKNKKKLKEIEELLGDLNLRILSLADFPRAPKIIEDGKTFDQNAIKKAATISMYTGKLTMGEDSGLEVNALKNKPGVYSSRYSGEDATDRKNNLKLLRDLKGTPLKRRAARYRCSIAIADKHKLITVVNGSCNGLIGFRSKGSTGFGYDPLFLIPKYNKTFAELGEKIKHTMSHRAKAIKKAKKVMAGFLRK
ncbi:MAG: RdgB/HAM1 family non-canonical purine NTP pyrophosphatase [Candidatus Omnitrophica bacterium]|nr:RdgB/HAM1 family non-canonical purine NTP pyrophosphatase [Candidatus Omnitrophota bacterium]